MGGGNVRLHLPTPPCHDAPSLPPATSVPRDHADLQGAKAQHKREMAQKNGVKTGPTSQLKANAAAQSIKCDICKQTFQSTSKRPQLDTHRESKHSKETFEKCFPEFVAA